MTNEMLQRAVALARSGHKDQARELFLQVLHDNPASETAWLWLTDCTADPAERIQILETCLQYVPNSRAAQAGLAALRRQFPQAAETPPPAAEPHSAEERTAASAGEETPAAQDEWPKLREQIRLEPWMEEISDDAGPALGALLGKPEEAEGLPGRARAYDNLPTLPARRFEQPPAFTVPPDQISEEEFNEVKNRTEEELSRRPEIRPQAAFPNEAAFEPADLAPQAEFTVEEEQPAAGEILFERPAAQDQPQAAAAEPEIEAGQPELGPTAPYRARRKAAARKSSARSKTLRVLLLVILGLAVIAAILFALILSL